MEDGTLTGLFADEGNESCFNYSECTFKYAACNQSVRTYLRYTSASAAWVLLCSIIVFFMKAGFMLVELAFASSVRDRRHVVILKHQDAFASAFGFFFIGFDFISGYSSPQRIPRQFFRITDPMLWFFKFTFASNAATIVGGVLVANKYKLRLPAAFLSAFFISGIIHPAIARLIWSDDCNSLSPYRFCNTNSNTTCNYGCDSSLSLSQRMYVLDFAGGGAVHMLGGIAALIISLFAKLQEYRDSKRHDPRVSESHQRLNDITRHRAGMIQEAEEQEVVTPRSFLEWMYPVGGGEESVSFAALGVVILWFCWFAFNCGSTESVQTGREETLILPLDETYYPYYGIPSTIAVNMILSAASGGMLAVAIAVWAQVRSRSESVNANEIANGILSALVGITAGCAFVDYWAACLIGALSVVLYHVGCFAEYKFKIKDTARVVPVHGVCGLWSLLAIGVFQFGGPARCNLHAAFEGLCYCHLRLPSLSQGEVMAAQLSGALIMIGMSVVACSLLYGTLYVIPIQPFVRLAEKIFFLTPKDVQPLHYEGGWLFTSPTGEFMATGSRLRRPVYPEPSDVDLTDGGDDTKTTTQREGGGTRTHKSNYGSLASSQTPVISWDSNRATYNSGSRVEPSGSQTDAHFFSKRIDSPIEERDSEDSQ
jgi:Amt family ammonium transporter